MSFGWVPIVIHPQFQYILKPTVKIEKICLVSVNASQILCKMKLWITCGTRIAHFCLNSLFHVLITQDIVGIFMDIRPSLLIFPFMCVDLQMSDWMTLLGVRIMLHLRSFTGHIVWKQIYGVLVLLPISYYVEVDLSMHGQNLEFFVQCLELILTLMIYLGLLLLLRPRTLWNGS